MFPMLSAPGSAALQQRHWWIFPVKAAQLRHSSWKWGSVRSDWEKP